MFARAFAPIAVAVAAAALSPAARAQSPLYLPDLTQGDPFFYTADQFIKADDGQKELVGVGRPSTTHSRIPHLPVYMGYMNTNYTYRFVNVAEQVLTMLGEGKHGLWRVQENGFVREYLRKGAQGLAESADPNDPGLRAIVERDYAAFLPDEGFDGYKYPDQRVAKGRLQYIDLPITHPKYGGRYTQHAPIDLSFFYCTMSEADFPYAAQAMNFAFAQAGANQVGPLGKRAGLDVRENFTNVLRIEHLPDARSWANTGRRQGDHWIAEWQPIDVERTQAEYYLVERPFFNKPYLFALAVYDNKDNDDLRYLRPAGAYYKALEGRGDKIRHEVVYNPRFAVEGGGTAAAQGLPIYGVHHPNRDAFGGGGACPLKGGDWGRYPDVRGGSGWPTQYEEITPLCEGVMIDIKFYSNLDGRSWSEPTKYLANAGAGTQRIDYKVQPGLYGQFSDPYNVEHGKVNPQMLDVPAKVPVDFATVEPPVGFKAVKPLPPNPAFAPAPSTSCRPIPKG